MRARETMLKGLRNVSVLTAGPLLFLTLTGAFGLLAGLIALLFLVVSHALMCLPLPRTIEPAEESPREEVTNPDTAACVLKDGRISPTEDDSLLN